MHINWLTLFGLLAAVCTTISFLPQVIKTIKIKETKDISLLMYIVLTIGIILWLIYGILIKDFPIMIANAVTLILAATVLFLKVKHG
jgi:MtN3 and saliva related transmembrane protein